MVVGMQAGLISRRERLGTVGAGAGQRLDTRSGSGWSARKLPGWPLRLGLSPGAGRSGLAPREGGRLELSGVFGGCPSLASRSATRRVGAAICAACASTNTIRSSLDKPGRVSRSIAAVNHAADHPSTHQASRQGEQLPPSTTGKESLFSILGFYIKFLLSYDTAIS